MELQYKGLRILSRYCSCQDSEFWSAMETSSVDIDKLLSKNFFLWIQCPKISLLLFKDGADLRMESCSCKQSPHTLLLGGNGFTLLTTCHLILKLMFFFFNFQTWSLSVLKFSYNILIWKMTYANWISSLIRFLLVLYTFLWCSKLFLVLLLYIQRI